MAAAGGHWVERYATELKQRARLLREYGDDRGAQIAELHAHELTLRQVEFDAEEITIEQAAEESGYHPEVLRRLKREGKWSGRRADLPRHARAPESPQLVEDEAPSDGSVSIADRINARRAGRLS